MGGMMGGMGGMNEAMMQAAMAAGFNPMELLMQSMMASGGGEGMYMGMPNGMMMGQDMGGVEDHHHHHHQGGGEDDMEEEGGVGPSIACSLTVQGADPATLVQLIMVHPNPLESLSDVAMVVTARMLKKFITNHMMKLVMKTDIPYRRAEYTELVALRKLARADPAVDLELPKSNMFLASVEEVFDILAEPRFGSENVMAMAKSMFESVFKPRFGMLYPDPSRALIGSGATQAAAVMALTGGALKTSPLTGVTYTVESNARYRLFENLRVPPPGPGQPQPPAVLCVPSALRDVRTSLFFLAPIPLQDPKDIFMVISSKLFKSLIEKRAVASKLRLSRDLPLEKIPRKARAILPSHVKDSAHAVSVQELVKCLKTDAFDSRATAFALQKLLDAAVADCVHTDAYEAQMQ